MLAILQEMAGQVAARLQSLGLAGRTVSIKMRFSDYTTVTRAHTVRLSTLQTNPRAWICTATATEERRLVSVPGSHQRTICCRASFVGDTRVAAMWTGISRDTCLGPPVPIAFYPSEVGYRLDEKTKALRKSF